MSQKLTYYTLGRGGVVNAADKKEGDGATPLGTYPLREVWYRPDRVEKPVSDLPVREITPEDCWCDDAGHGLYNRHFQLAPLLPLGEEQDLVSDRSVAEKLSKSEEGKPPQHASPHQLSRDSQASLRKLASPLKGEEKSVAQYPVHHTKQAKQLRKNATDVEKKFWYRIRNKQINGAKFRRQQPIGPYIADFVCQSHKLIIELDGGQHNEYTHKKADDKRDAFFQTEGYHVLRFWNHDVLGNIDGVLESVASTLESLGAPMPSPAFYRLASEPKKACLSPKGRGDTLPASFERLWREDGAYDVIVVIGYNDDPPIPGKGSAIFIHCMHDDGRPTAGCVALEKQDLLTLISSLTPSSTIRIEQNGVSII